MCHPCSCWGFEWAAASRIFTITVDFTIKVIKWIILLPMSFFARFSQISNFWSCYESYFQITQLWMSPKESSTYYRKFYQWQIFTLTLSVLLNNIIVHPIKAVLTVNVCNCVPWKASIKWITPPFVANKIIFPSELNLTPVHSMLGSFWMWKVENGPWRKQFTYA